MGNSEKNKKETKSLINMLNLEVEELIDEEWIYKPENKKAFESLKRGLKEANQGKIKKINIKEL